MIDPIHVIGAGLAGSECAWQLAERGIPVRLYEMKPARRTPAQTADYFAELVCSNSFRSDNPNNAVGLLHEELRRLGSLIFRLAQEHRVPAGDALAVDRDLFGQAVEAALRGHPNIQVIGQEVAQIPPSGTVVVATGPLTSDALAGELAARTGRERLAFYDAIAPIVADESIDRDKVFAASRWGKGDGDDYLNCPMDKPQYTAFVEALLAAEPLPLQDFEKDVHYFQGCQPIEVIAASGPKSLRFGPMKPTGLDDPRTGRWPYAVVQLRAENRHKTAWNLVGFQTKMRQADQRRVLGMIPGLENAEFLRYGSVHRNTFLDSPRLLQADMALRHEPRLHFAGQITGVEGYVESTASGLWVGLALAAARAGCELPLPPPTTALGALLHHVLNAEAPAFQPSNVHFGLFTPLEPEPGVRKLGKSDRKSAHSQRARGDLGVWRAACPLAIQPVDNPVDNPASDVNSIASPPAEIGDP
ncbi:MAG: methylenetetrahydrofolate--tRNA-(uracil(54)-C(5))-methyltransferase (FADH(2)-oxidizing) TrmFO [Deltaproteobacteria bacterium]|nr:methylenetetrahydrofolate--tRNA-(uracil(54)-C(5))-methyltransferase (FADH(2)-oxidizing) TrmFO [Deltaproteobacteria bacterium]